MTFHDTFAPTFDSDDLFAHWRDEDARIADEWRFADERDAAYQAVAEGDVEAVSAAHDAGLVDDATFALVVYGCMCRRCRKLDPGGCVGE